MSAPRLSMNFSATRHVYTKQQTVIHIIFTTESTKKTAEASTKQTLPRSNHHECLFHEYFLSIHDVNTRTDLQCLLLTCGEHTPTHCHSVDSDDGVRHLVIGLQV